VNSGLSPDELSAALAGVAIVGVGSSVPAVTVDNTRLSEVVDTSDEWIRTRTGIQARRLADPATSVATLATQAARSALDMAQVQPVDVDLVILATSTPDDLFGTAALVQAGLGAVNAAAFDLTAACSGFVFGLVTASQFIRTGTYRTIVLIGADILSRWVDWSDRRTCVLFGDGAGAVVLRAHPQNHLLSFELRSDGSQNACLTLAYKGEPTPLVSDVSIQQGTFSPIFMNGQDVYRFAVKRVPELLEKALFRANMTAQQVDWLLLHQANVRILDAVAERLKIPPEKVIRNLHQHGNTSAASIPLALDAEVRSGRIKPGDVIAMSGFGAGLTWGAAVIRWGAEV
jgi:3-oxoacyl-[acyl-carrier-protein] synthase III